MALALLIQWGIVAVFVAFHFLIGFIRGTSKSAFYTFASIILTITLFWALSFVSIRLFFSDTEALYNFAQSVSNQAIPTNVEQYILDPDLSGVVFFVIDIVFRIILLLLLYPIVKRLLLWLVFMPIWKTAIFNNLLKRQNEKEKEEFRRRSDRKGQPKLSHKLKPNPASRLGGGLIGAFHGVFLAIIFLLPVIVLANLVSDLDGIVQLQSDNTITLGNSTNELVTLPDEFADYFDQINELNEKGLGFITRQIKIGNKSIDHFLFDLVFTVELVDPSDQVTKIELGSELASLVGIATVVIEGGYLKDDFEFEEISSHNLPDIEKIFGYLGQSKLLTGMIPIATRYGVNNQLSDYLEVNLYERQASSSALDSFENVVWEDEFDRLYQVTEVILQFGSIAELMNYAENPELLAELTLEQRLQVVEIIEALSRLETLGLINAGLDYATTLEGVQSQLTWIPEANREDYLQDRLSFILENADYFTKENGSFKQLSHLLKTVASNEDVDFTVLLNNINNPSVFLSEDVSLIVGDILRGITDVDLFIDVIPFGLDFLLYRQLGTQVEEALAEEIIAAFEDINWSDEFENIASVYETAARIGLANFFNNPDVSEVIDTIIINHMDSVREIVERIFERSEVVNAALLIASPIILDTFVENQDLKTIIEEVLYNSETNELDFAFGAEINRLINVVEISYQFTSYSEIMNLNQNFSVHELANLVARFGELSESDYNKFVSSLTELQLLNRAIQPALLYVRDYYFNDLFVPVEVELGNDLRSVFGLAYTVGEYLSANQATANQASDIDIIELVNSAQFRSYLVETPQDNHSNLLLANIANYIITSSANGSLERFIAIPNLLIGSPADSALWRAEVTNLLNGFLDLTIAFDATGLSVNEAIQLIDEPSNLKIDLVTQFSSRARVDEVFGNLDGSLIFRASAYKAASGQESIMDKFIPGLQIQLPLQAVDGQLLAINAFTELIHGAISLFTDMNRTLGYDVIGQIRGINYRNEMVVAFNAVEDGTFDDFAESRIIRGVVSQLLLQDAFHEFLATKVSGLGFNVEASLFQYDTEDGYFTKQEVIDLFISLRTLQIQPSFMQNPSGDLSLLTNLIDENDPDDDFMLFLKSDYLYTILARAFDADFVGEFTAEMINEIFGKDLDSYDMSVPDDAKGTSDVEDGLISKVELRQVFVSVKYLDISGEPNAESVSIGTLLDLIDQNINGSGEDDFDRFLKSIYVADKISKLLLSETVRSMIANDRFDQDEIALTSAATHSNGRMTNLEIHRLFKGLKILDISDFDNISFEYSTLTQLSDSDLNLVLVSEYLYIVIDLSFRSEVDDDLLHVKALYDTTHDLYSGRVTHDEIKQVFKAIGILNVDNLNDPIEAVSGLTTDKLVELLDLASYFVYRFVSQSILESNLSIPDQSYAVVIDVNYDETKPFKDIKIHEMYLLVEAMDIMGIVDLDGTFDANIITLTDLKALASLEYDDQQTSSIVNRLLSQTIIDVLDPTDIPSTAYEVGSSDDLLREEVISLIEAMIILSANEDVTIDDVTPIDDTGLTSQAILELIDLDGRIVLRLISQGIIDAGIDNADAYATADDDNFDSEAINQDIKIHEMYGLVDAMDILGILNITEVFVSINLANVSVLADEEIDNLLEADPIAPTTIIYYLLADQVPPHDDPLTPFDYETFPPYRVTRDSLITHLKSI